MIKDLTPKESVKKLDEFIIGQSDAKKAVAIALRNRARRLALREDPIKDEIYPKNIIMIGPTGVGKTEIARRLARLVQAPFVKVEATKYTEVGYVGRDVESMVRDLLGISLKIIKEEHKARVKEKATSLTEDRIIDILLKGSDKNAPTDTEENAKAIFKNKLRSGALEDIEIEIKTKVASIPTMQIMAIPGMEEIENQMQNLLGDIFPKKRLNKRKMKIKDARKILEEEEIEDLLDFEKIKTEAIERVEQNGIIFIDEIDKIAEPAARTSGNISREGVQRDILPLVEGSSVQTRHGQVKTDHVLFITAGAFHISSITDLIPELQGRFPIRVELKPLNKEDYISILRNPKNALSKQYQALLSTEDIALTFDTSGYASIAEIAYQMNTKSENIGARRLYTIMEKLLEELSFESEKFKGKEVLVNKEFVEKQLKHIVDDQDLSRYIL